MSAFEVINPVFLRIGLKNTINTERLREAKASDINTAGEHYAIKYYRPPR